MLHTALEGYYIDYLYIPWHIEMHIEMVRYTHLKVNNFATKLAWLGYHSKTVFYIFV